MSNTKVVYMRMNFKGFIIFILFFPFSYVCAQGNFNGLSRGELLFKENNAKDAVQVLEYEILNGQISDNSYNLLGLGYYQLGEYEKSLDAFKRGIKAQPSNSKILSYNMGNTYYALKDYSSAVSCYSDSIKADPLFYEAKLNRANALLMSGQLVSAKEEYIDFIAKCPSDPQKEKIERLIKALSDEITKRDNESRLLAEQNKAKWEEYDGRLEDIKRENFIPDWEQVESGFENSVKKSDSITKNEQKVEDNVDWLTFSESDLDEMKSLEEESRLAHEQWLENERRRAKEAELRETLLKQQQQQQSLEDERKFREQLLEDIRKSEEERRKKLLEDVANSLQGNNSTNETSGAEDLIDYNLEGELD